MNRRRLLARLLVTSAFPNTILHAEEYSAQILKFPTYPNDPRLRIRKPGNYKIAESRTQRKLIGGGHEGPRGGAMVLIFCGRVDIDLGGNTLGADFGVGGITMSYNQNAEFAAEFPDKYSEASLDSRFVSIRNGTIDMARGDRTLMGIALVGEWSDLEEGVSSRPTISVDGADQPNMNISYTRSEHMFEGLRLLAHSIAIGIEGSHTTIRNCVIESSSNAAIFIAGPNVTIENCEIRLRSADDSWYVKRDSTRAAIVLRDGSNAVIRNNRIRVDYGGSIPCTTLCILVSDGAKNVLIENNTFINVEGDPVTLTDGAEATVLNNRSEKKQWPW